VVKAALREGETPSAHIVFSLFTVGVNSAPAPDPIYEASTSHKTSMAVKDAMRQGHEALLGRTHVRQKPAHAPRNCFTNRALRPRVFAEANWTAGFEWLKNEYKFSFSRPACLEKTGTAMNATALPGLLPPNVMRGINGEGRP